MKKYFVLLLIVLSQPSVAAIDPAYYQFNSKSTYESAMEGWQNGVKIAEQAERTRQQREATREKANQASREESYRAELKGFYTNPNTLNEENLLKLMLLYPEFNDTTLKIKSSYDELNKTKEKKQKR